ncbi:hypothetical protein HOC96_03225 [archaeon]|nr:hypothetical protein [archaeon]
MVGEYLIKPSPDQLLAEADLLIRVASKGLQDLAIYSLPGVQKILTRNGISSYATSQADATDSPYLSLSLAGDVLNSVQNIVPTNFKPYTDLKSRVGSAIIDEQRTVEDELIRAYVSINLSQSPGANRESSVTASGYESNLANLVSIASGILLVREGYLSTHNHHMLTHANDTVGSALGQVENAVKRYAKSREGIGKIIVPRTNNSDELISGIKTLQEKVSELPSLYVAFSNALSLGDNLIGIGSDVERIKGSIDKIAINEVQRVATELQLSSIQLVSRYFSGSITLDEFTNNFLSRSYLLKEAGKNLSPIVSEQSGGILAEKILSTNKWVKNYITNFALNGVDSIFDKYGEAFLDAAISELSGNVSDLEAHTLSVKQIATKIENRFLPFVNLVLDHPTSEDISQRCLNLQRGASKKIQFGIRVAMDANDYTQSAYRGLNLPDDDDTVIISDRVNVPSK